MNGLLWQVENMILTLNLIFGVIVEIVNSEAQLTGKLVLRYYCFTIELCY